MLNVIIVLVITCCLQCTNLLFCESLSICLLLCEYILALFVYLQVWKCAELLRIIMMIYWRISCLGGFLKLGYVLDISLEFYDSKEMWFTNIMVSIWNKPKNLNVLLVYKKCNWFLENVTIKDLSKAFDKSKIIFLVVISIFSNKLEFSSSLFSIVYPPPLGTLKWLSGATTRQY